MNRRLNRLHGRGFSLMEVMLAVFILGIGVISVAAIFPAGISQQRRSNDDIMGPIVAENAIATLRSKLDQEDFGYFEMFVGSDQIPFDTTTGMIYGDWPWYRPGFVFSDDQNVSAIDIFSAQQARISAGYAQGGVVGEAEDGGVLLLRL